MLIRIPIESIDDELILYFEKKMYFEKTNYQVREMFLEMVQAIRAHQNLWMLDENFDGPMHEAGEGQENCSVQ